MTICVLWDLPGLDCVALSLNVYHIKPLFVSFPVFIYISDLYIDYYRDQSRPGLRIQDSNQMNSPMKLTG